MQGRSKTQEQIAKLCAVIGARELEVLHNSEISTISMAATASLRCYVTELAHLLGAEEEIKWRTGAR